MTNDEIRIAVAELHGWVYEGRDEHNEPYWTSPTHRFETLDDLPDYATDLNLWHEIETKMSFGQSALYEMFLQKFVNTPYLTEQTSIIGAIWHATAAQRAEAFLSTIGKLKTLNENL